MTITIKFLMFIFLFNSNLGSRSFSGDSKNKRTPINELNINTDSIKSRIEHINSTTPFQIDYTPQLEKSIIKYLEKKQATYLDLYGKSRYYFPIFEQALQKYNVPLELKYLPIVESSLNPKAKSRAGATGLWQFMFNTAKSLGLKVNSYVDERMDPIKSSDAAAKYLSELYIQFKDWNLAIAAYNYGPTNIKRVIKASGYSNFWNLRGYLPTETANYVPSFLSTLYLFEYASEHNIETEKTKHLQLLTDTLLIKKKVSFSHISDEINIPLDSLKFLNPAYVHNIIPLIKNKDHFLTLPQIYTENFIQKESIIYEQAALDYDSREKPLPHLYELNSRTVYKVVSGDFLGKIANNYGVNISNIKKWNKLKNDRLNIGQRLILFPRKFPKKQ